MTSRRGPFAGLRGVLGSRIAPPRFVLFAGVMLGTAAVLRLGGFTNLADALVLGFDVGAGAFALSLWPLLRDRGVDQMRRHARENDANRSVVLVLTGFVALAVLAAITGELPAARHGNAVAIVKLVVTLGLSWAFTNLVFMLHYAHMYYLPAARAQGGTGAAAEQEARGPDRGGFDFPATPYPDYWDFLYFAFTAGMSFAASDVDVTRGAVRRIVVLHSLLSFVFNIGVLAFSINVLAGAAS